MAWANKEQIEKLLEIEEGKNLIESIGELEQEEFENRYNKIFNIEVLADKIEEQIEDLEESDEEPYKPKEIILENLSNDLGIQEGTEAYKELENQIELILKEN